MAHRRHGNQLVVGLASPLVWLMRIWVPAFVVLALAPVVVYGALGGGLLTQAVTGQGALQLLQPVGLLILPVAALWLADARRRLAPWLLAALSVACTWPAVALGFWPGTPQLPSLFTNSRYRDVITSRETALLLPVGIFGNSMLWQAEAGLRFKMASGYVVPPEAPDPYKHDPAYATLTSGTRVPDMAGAAETFLSTHRVTVAVVDPSSPQATPWIPILERLGWKAQTVGGPWLCVRTDFPPPCPSRTPAVTDP